MLGILRCICLCKESTSVLSMKFAAGINSSLHSMLCRLFSGVQICVSLGAWSLTSLCASLQVFDLQLLQLLLGSLGKAIFLLFFCEYDTSNMFLPIPSCGLVLYWHNIFLGKWQISLNLGLALLALHVAGGSAWHCSGGSQEVVGVAHWTYAQIMCFREQHLVYETCRCCVGSPQALVDFSLSFLPWLSILALDHLLAHQQPWKLPSFLNNKYLSFLFGFSSFFL